MAKFCVYTAYFVCYVVSMCLCVCRTNPITWTGQEMLLVPCEQPFEQLKNVQLLYQGEDEEEDEDEYTDEITLL